MQLLESGDVARRLEKSTARVHDLVREGLLQPFATTPRGVRLFREADVAKFLERRQRGAEAK